MYYYEIAVRGAIWEYLHEKYDSVDRSDLTVAYLLKNVDLNSDYITGIASGSYFCDASKAEECVLSAMCELDDLVNDDYITDEQLGYELRKEMYEDIDCIIRLRYATMLMPLIAVEYIEYRKGEKNNEKEND